MGQKPTPIGKGRTDTRNGSLESYCSVHHHVENRMSRKILVQEIGPVASSDPGSAIPTSVRPIHIVQRRGRSQSQAGAKPHPVVKTARRSQQFFARYGADKQAPLRLCTIRVRRRQVGALQWISYPLCTLCTHSHITRSTTGAQESRRDSLLRKNNASNEDAVWDSGRSQPELVIETFRAFVRPV